MTYSSFKRSDKYTPINSDAIANTLTTYKEVKVEWLLTGNGVMLKEENQLVEREIETCPHTIRRSGRLFIGCA